MTDFQIRHIGRKIEASDASVHAHRDDVKRLCEKYGEDINQVYEIEVLPGNRISAASIAFRVYLLRDGLHYLTCDRESGHIEHDGPCEVATEERLHRIDGPLPEWWEVTV